MQQLHYAQKCPSGCGTALLPVHRGAAKLSLLLCCLLGAVTARAQHNYGEVLQKSFYFYEAQQSGNLSPNNRVKWRGPAHVDDGKTVAGLDRDLSGGWYDAGDRWKSNTTMAYAVNLINWSAIQYPAAYTGTGQTEELKENIRHVNDYFLKCIVDPNPTSLTNFSGYEVYVDVGGNPGPDAFSLHSVWSAPEVTNGFTTREALKVNTTITGPDAAAAMAAAMASSSVIFHQYGTDAEKSYAQTLLQRARKLFAYANGYPFNAQSLIKNPANTWEWWPQGVTPGGGVRRINYRSQQSNDELLFAAGMLYKAEEVLGTAGNKTQYLTWAQNLVSTDQDSKPGPAEFTSNADFFKNTRDIFISQYNHLALMLWLQLQPADATFNSVQPYLYNFLELWYNYPKTPGGLTYKTEMSGSFLLKWNLNTTSLHMLYSDWTTDNSIKTRYFNFARAQMDYALGTNPAGRSYVVGYGSTYPRRTHHRGAHGGWAGFESITTTHPYFQDLNRHVLYGALVAGPMKDDTFTDAWGTSTHHYYAEVALDFNAGLHPVLAGLIAKNPASYPAVPDANFTGLPTRNTGLDWKTTDRQYFVVARVSATTDRSLKIEADLHNQSRWPARVTANPSFRYYFTLDNDATAANITATVNTSEGATVGSVTQLSGKTYYVELKFTGKPVMPNRIYQVSNRPGGANYPDDDLFRRTVVFTLAADVPGRWDNTNDFSYAGLTATATIRPALPVYDNGTYLEGEVPAAGPANQAPTVSITSPANNASFTAGATVTLTANAADADGSVAKVEFYYGSTRLGEDTGSPYSYTWSNVPAGTHSLTARATDNTGAVTTSAAISITVTASGGGAALKKLDFNAPGSPTATGYTAVPLAVYSATAGFGWNSIADVNARDRYTADPLKRDLHVSVLDKEFYVDLPNGTYAVSLYIGDASFAHNLMDVSAEGVPVVSDLTLAANEFRTVTFNATVADGQLTLKFHQDGGAYNTWAINGIDVVTAASGRLEVAAADAPAGTQITLYPNPGAREIRLAGAVSRPAAIRVTNASGVAVALPVRRAGTNEVMLDASALKPGLYLITVPAGNAQVTRRLIVR